MSVRFNDVEIRTLIGDHAVPIMRAFYAAYCIKETDTKIQALWKGLSLSFDKFFSIGHWGKAQKAVISSRIMAATTPERAKIWLTDYVARNSRSGS